MSFMMMERQVKLKFSFPVSLLSSTPSVLCLLHVITGKKVTGKVGREDKG